jgi:hypothetical protein
MDRRFAAARIAGRGVVLAAIFAVAACSTGPASEAGSDVPDAAAIAAAGSPEERLSLQSRAMQRTVLEGAMIGAGLGAAGNTAYARPIPFGVVIGASVGASYGSYLAFLQARYANNEARLEKMTADAAATNAETAAAIETMRVVLDRQSRDLAALRAGSPDSPALQAAVTEAEASLNDMRVAINGAENRRGELAVTKASLEPAPEMAAVDSQIADLGTRIAEMRAIADTLAAEL